MIRKTILLLTASMSLGAIAEDVKFGSGQMTTKAIYNAPKNSSTEHPPAVVLIHTAGGYSDGTTADLRDSLNDAGFATLEPQYFKDYRSRIPPDKTTSTIFSALKFLVEEKGVDPDRIGIAGYSYGANMSLLAMSEYLTETYGNGLKYAASAPIYPPCWLNEQLILGKRNIKGIPVKVKLPDETFVKMTNIPTHIFVAGKDDYDDRDPNACNQMVKAFPVDAQKNVSLTLYPDATHGWNLVQAKRKPIKDRVPYGCKGKGCQVTRVYDEKVHKQSVKDVTEFLVNTLKN